MFLLLPISVMVGLFTVLAGALLAAEKLLVDYGECRIDVVDEDGDKPLIVQGGHSLLEELLTAEYKVQNSCGGKGSCGFCKVRIVEGGGNVLPTERPFLSRRDIASGMRLACQVRVRGDIKVEMPDYLDIVEEMVRSGKFDDSEEWRFSIQGEQKGETGVLDENTAMLESVDSIINKNKGKNRGLIELLQNVSEEFNYLPRVALQRISERTNVPLSRIYSIVTFYQDFKLQPQGEHRVQVCSGTACHVKGAASMADLLSRALKIQPGETTPDGRITLETVNCVGLCGVGPVVIIDEEYYTQMNAEKALELLEKI